MSGRVPEQTEPNLHDLLTEPIVRLVMQADNVDEQTLRVLLQRTAANMRKYRAVSSNGVEEALPSSEERSGYRLGVGIMLVNEKGGIFVGQRIDMSEEAWQMPQGGVDEGETPKQAALRELQEELGTSKAEIVTSTDSWLRYDLPAGLVNQRPHGHWRGQLQKWVLMRFRGQDTDINVATEHPEFSHWQWVTPKELIKLIVPFKRPLYVAVLEEFAAHIDNG